MKKDEVIRPTSILLNNRSLTRTQRLFLKVYYVIHPASALKMALKWVQPGTYLHCQHVERIALAVGATYTKKFHSKINVGNLKHAAFFHDIGKLSIQNDVLTRKHLTAADRWLIRRHPEVGALVLRGLFNPSVCAAVLSHHEERNATGYPRGIGDKKLSLITEIISTVDDYCAMIERRGYNKPLNPEKAVAQLEHEIGTRYDERIVSILKARLSVDPH